MITTQKIKKERRNRRRSRVGSRIFGTAGRPRLSVYRSLRHIYGQLIDDQNQKSITGASSLSPELRKELQEKVRKTEVSKKVGIFLGRKALEKGIVQIVFDRGPYKYHGRLKAFAEGMREAGLKF